MSNLELWNAVERTPVDQTKQITGKPYKGTSPKPHWLVWKATETFGPIGIGWGFKVLSEEIVEGEADKLHKAHVRVWYEWQGKRGEVEHIGATALSGKRRDGTPFTDEDAPKKSVTDALVKALSMIGFAGDIFMGRYDDSKYVAELREEERAQATPPKPEPTLEQKATMAQSSAKVIKDAIAERQTVADLNALKADEKTAAHLQRLHEGYLDLWHDVMAAFVDRETEILREAA